MRDILPELGCRPMMSADETSPLLDRVRTFSVFGGPEIYSGMMLSENFQIIGDMKWRRMYESDEEKSKPWYCDTALKALFCQVKYISPVVTPKHILLIEDIP